MSHSTSNPGPTVLDGMLASSASFVLHGPNLPLAALLDRLSDATVVDLRRARAAAPTRVRGTAVVLVGAAPAPRVLLAAESLFARAERVIVLHAGRPDVLWRSRFGAVLSAEAATAPSRAVR
jgi:hypothetical protein